MKKEVSTFIAGVALAGSVVAGVAAFDTDAPTKSAGWADPGSPVACVDATCGSPIPTIAVPTATPTVFIVELPDTGTGSSR